MSDPFADGLAVLHGSVLGIDAIYTGPSGEPVPLRVIRSQGSEINGTMILDRDVVSIMRIDVPLPARRATVQLLGSIGIEGMAHVDPVFRITQDPMLDEEGLSWSCPIELA